MNFQKIKNKPTIILSPAVEYDASYKELPAGVYQLHIAKSMLGSIHIAFEPLTQSEPLIEFNDGALKDILTEVQAFFSPKTKAAFEEMQIMYKVGYILYGPAGTGKTCLATLALNNIAKKYNAICLDCTKAEISDVKAMIKTIREIQNNNIVLFFDECERDLKDHENSFLPFLDGNESVNGLIFIGCTNYLKKIPDRIKNRKSRIKKCFEITSLPAAIYKQYIKEKLPKLDEKTMQEFCFKAVEAGLTIDQFKNAILDYKLYGVKIDLAIEDAKKVYASEPVKQKNIISDFLGGFGFRSGGD